MMNFLKRHRIAWYRLLDISLIIISCYLACGFGNYVIGPKEKIILTLVSIIIYQLIFTVLEIYKFLLNFTGTREYARFTLAVLISSVLVLFFYNLISIYANVESAGFETIALSTLLIGLSTMSFRGLYLFFETYNRAMKNKKNKNRKNILVIGGGFAGSYVVKDLVNNHSSTYNIVGIIDDDPSKHGFSISGVKIIGGRECIEPVCKAKNVDTILFAIPSIDSYNKIEILNICSRTNAKVRILPDTNEIIKTMNYKGLNEHFREIDISDLLARDPVKLDEKEIRNYICNKVVLVTGGGGSIGSELCKKIMDYNPKQLVILDIYENNLYDIDLELRTMYPDRNIAPVVASIRDEERLNEVFSTYRPNIVFHAAAHKHVPLMEHNPQEAIKNNVFGSYSLMKLSDKYNVEKFVMISTDKAVNPTSIMGATKRICEMMISAFNSASKTDYVAVRFGNVLGSNGSVVPLFKKQIAMGGPVTVTHKDITRFFMTIPEAAQLVLQAVTYAKGGEIFVLDMGKPVKIYDLAVKMIKLSGLEPNVDIMIKITGLRPGEKLYEELLMAEEGLIATLHESIFISSPINVTMEKLEDDLEKLKNCLHETNHELIRQVVKQIVPTYVYTSNEEDIASIAN